VPSPVRRGLLDTFTGKEKTMTSFVEPIDDLNFDSEVLGSQVPFLLDFSATWCAPCRALNPILEGLAEQQRGALRVGKIDIDSSPAVAARFGVRGAPTLLVFRNGKEAARRIGLTNRDGLLKLVDLPGAASAQPSSATAR
jgi:thioredoxin 1